MQLTSSAFRFGESLPDRFSREGGNVSPPLLFSDVPAPTQSLALIMDDPDAPRGVFTHWVLFNLEPNVGVLTENHVPGGTPGRNDWGEVGYGGPRPPSGTHRYFFHAFALDGRLALPRGATRREVEQALEGHVLARAELMGRFTAAHVHA
ncbi:YbhB/YbcL family Raf kinase inhibitor-like protein [Opitutus terrae]|uniref:PEBP family protein n=1 Tax=Opitutus terrae (strain DSM 11246 / JCM 15787 / PB90-1) TaxID=452637 RepID=B2A005_OPITP|nr:YbhB/YbcL family Raf kinase inhibitor-like protein [Opitutus terrae]ACB77341.1 PEBP family protein [Opitutus terrae PB90-1]